jgi:O-methyltransferase
MSSARRLASKLRAEVVRRLFRGNMVNALETVAVERVVQDFMRDEVGADYGVTRAQKEAILDSMRRAYGSIPSGTHWSYHALMACRILSLPPSVEGHVVECGTYKGCSASNLSLVCRAAKRKLYVCDSFEGLPEDDGSVHNYPDAQVYGFYQPGMYAGALEEVQANIGKHGALEVCEFVKGYFCDTLHTVPGPIAFAFLDVDLVSSTRDCIVHLWPKLIDGGYMYTDDAADMAVMKVWFDDAWWQEHLGCPAPGYVGSGCGLAVRGHRSSLGYAHKVSNYESAYGKVEWLVYPGEDAQQAGVGR